jgi:hypothetical protein
MARNEQYAINSLPIPKYYLFIYFLAIEAFNTLVLVYGYVSDFCTATSCPTMNAGEKYVINSIIYDVY